jgi:hypothetical protein
MSRFTNREKQHNPGASEMSNLETILANYNAGLELQAKVVSKRVKDVGYDGLTGYEFSISIAGNYFGPGFFDRNHGKTTDISDQLFDCCDAIFQTVRAARPIKTPLKRSLDELEFMISARLPKRGPPSTRMISAQTLQLVAGILPTFLVPINEGVRTQGKFGEGLFDSVLAGPVVMLEAKPSKSPPKKHKNFTVPNRSPPLRAMLDFYSASDKLVGFAPRAAKPWPTSLVELGFQPDRPITRDISVGSILKLPPQHLEDFRTRCELTLQELRTRFGIGNRYDPLDIGTATPSEQPPMAMLLNRLCELISPFPDIAESQAYDIIYIAPSRGAKSGKARESALYPLIYQHVKHCLNLKARHATNAMRLAGLLDPCDNDNTECDRYIQRYIACHRQFAIISAVKRRLEQALANVEFASKKSARVSGCNVRVKWSDLQNLGRWSEYLRGRLGCGEVDRGRHQNARLPIPAKTDWKWPAGMRVDQTLAQSVGPLVRTARIASRTALAKKPG